MRLTKSILYGYLGAIAAGLVVALLALPFGLTEKTMVATAVPAGFLFGAFGLLWPWRQAALARIRRR